MLFNCLLALAAISGLAQGELLQAKTLGQLPLGTWLESVVVRGNGDLLGTQMWPSATIYTIQNPSGCSPHLEELVSIPAIGGLLGISKVPERPGKPETYIVVGSNATALSKPIEGTFSAWTIEFNNKRNQAKVKVKKISDMSKNSKFLNGVVQIPGEKDAFLVSDSFNGLVGRLDMSSGHFDTSAFVFPEMAARSASSFGVNGIKIRQQHLYFTNSDLVSIYRIAITAEGFPARGAKPDLVADLSKNVRFLDDFDFDTHGNIYAASNFDNSVVFLDVKTGEWKTVVGSIGELTVAGSTALAFGHGKTKDTFYVVTSGALAMPVNGTVTEGAKIVSVNTRP